MAREQRSVDALRTGINQLMNGHFARRTLSYAYKQNPESVEITRVYDGKDRAYEGEQEGSLWVERTGDLILIRTHSTSENTEEEARIKLARIMRRFNQSPSLKR